MNLYAYVGNNPLNFYDPSGLCKGVLKDIWDWWYGGLYNFGYEWGVGVEEMLQAEAAFKQDWNESIRRRRAARYLQIYGQPSLPSFAERTNAFYYELGHDIEATGAMLAYVVTGTVNRLLEPLSELSMVEDIPPIHIAASPYNPEIHITGDTIKLAAQVADWVNTEFRGDLAAFERQAYEDWKWHQAQEWQYGNMEYIGPEY